MQCLIWVECINLQENFQILLFFYAFYSKIKTAIKDLARNGEIEPIIKEIQNFLFHHCARDKETFTEMNIKHTMEILLSFTSQYNVYGEYPALPCWHGL